MSARSGLRRLGQIRLASILHPDLLWPIMLYLEHSYGELARSLVAGALLLWMTLLSHWSWQEQVSLRITARDGAHCVVAGSLRPRWQAGSVLGQNSLTARPKWMAAVVSISGTRKILGCELTRLHCLFACPRSLTATENISKVFQFAALRIAKNHHNGFLKEEY